MSSTGKGWRYGGGGVGALHARKSFLVKQHAYKYRSECFSIRLKHFLDEHARLLPNEVVASVTKRLHEEISKTC